MPLEFVGRTAVLSSAGKSALRWQIDGRRDFPLSRLLVIFYAAKPGRLLDQRRRAVQGYLLVKGMALEDISIAVTDRRSSPQFLSEWNKGKVPIASVELTRGGCH